MSLKPIQCSILVCDGCGDGDDNGDFVPHYAAGATADMSPLQDGGWYASGKPEGPDYCEDCRKTVPHDHIFEEFVCEICHADQPLDTSGICRAVQS
jgi:hypothetical protein